MRSATTQKLLSVLILLCIIPQLAIAQYYTDSSDNLPDDAVSFQSKDVLATDIDGDGDIDVILANEFQNNVVLINNGSGVFTRGGAGIPIAEEHDSEAITVADFNLDGQKDLIFVSEDDFEHEYYWNEGNGDFSVPPIFLPFTNCRAVNASDFNGDDLPDLMLGNNGQNFMMINDGAGEFLNQTTDRIPFVEDKTQDISTQDIDGDGDIDIFLASEDFNRILINDGTGVFTDESSSRLPQGVDMDSRTGVFEDVDMDGDPDLFLCNVEFSPGKNPTNRLYLNNGSGYFTDFTTNNTPGYTDQTLDAVFTDFDFDGDHDLIVANILGIPMIAYLNDGNGKFTDENDLVFGTPYMIEAFGVAKGDFNGDGLDDIYVCNRDGKDLLLIHNPIALSNHNIATLQAKLFPNPTNQSFRLEGDFGNDNWSFQLVDARGSLIKGIQPRETFAEGFQFEVPADLPNGLYFLNAIGTEKTGMVRFVIAR